MNANELYRLLTTIHHELDEKRCLWRVGGSAGLRVQGIDLAVLDLDIMVDERGLDVFRKAFPDERVRN